MGDLLPMNEPIFAWVILPLLIVIARIMDVSIGTVRIIMLGKGHKLVAAGLGFFEVLIWITVIGQLLQNIDNFLYYIAYATGYASGTYIGIWIENRLSIGKVVLRVITKMEGSELVDHLLANDYNLTSVDAEGRYGKVKIIFMVMERAMVPRVIDTINQYNPNAFFSIEDVRFVNKLNPVDSFEGPFYKRFNWRGLMLRK